MPAIPRLGDIGSGHACHFPPTPSIEASGNVFINGRGAVRVGDAYGAHACSSCPEPSHGRALAAGSPTVFINGQPAGRIGDAIDCGGTAAEGSGDVFLDDGA
ncbi:PAAR domain-containing protein [Agrobacterium vitis]|uniref:PAAR domain-containing protein n=1 Tax=Agrobacterium vitis TaxID=373 RepID=UPI0020356ADF|nr:PAAR domain-containing protein [Agrobacterium vitis]MCM2450522.1 hypothetical protein [Agrobacterium vitis]